jgi:sRNA-binding protein
MTEIKRPKKFKDKINLVVTDWLCVEYPNLFDIENPTPLAIGVGAVLQKKLPKHIDRKDYGLVMTWYCKKKRYLRAVIAQQYRYDLNGEIAAEITEEEKIKAKELLEQIEEQIRAKQSAEEQQKEKSVETVSVQEPVQEISQPEVVEEPKSIIETIEPVVESKPKTLSLKSKKTSTVPTEEVKAMTSTASQATAKGLKVTLVIDPASLPDIDTTGMKKAPISIFISNGEITATTEINAKSYRKALSSIQEYGADGCNVIIQGSMKQYGVIDDAGLVVQPKKQANAE